MPEVIPSVLMVYGDYGTHPWQEDMLHRRDLIQQGLTKYGFGLDIAMVTQPPTGTDTMPAEVLIARNPVFDQTGKLQEANFQPGTIANHAVIIDHWVRNYQDEVQGPDGSSQRTAYGIGTEPARTWNHWKIQNFGNQKDAMDTIIRAGEAGPATWPVTDYCGPGKSPIIYKPQGGAQAQGIEVFESIDGLRQALHEGRLAANGLVQLYQNNRAPIQGLIGDTAEDAEKLAYIMGPDGADRPRELRTHVITTMLGGGLHTDASTIVKVGKPGKAFLEYDFSIGLDQSCIEDSYLPKKCKELAQAVCYAADVDGQPIPQYYGVFDALVDGHVHDQSAIDVIDGNCRMPGLAIEAREARENFHEALAMSGIQAMAQAPVRAA